MEYRKRLCLSCSDRGFDPESITCCLATSGEFSTVRAVKNLDFCIFFYGVVIAAQYTATFLKAIVLPQVYVLGREYAD